MNISNLNIDLALAELFQLSVDKNYELLELLASSEPTYPKDHLPAMRVPKGGSSCSSCEYLADNKTDCTNEHFQKWHGSATIPAPIDEYCSDWYEENKDIQANYKLEGRTEFRGLNISIETDKGSERSGVGKDGTPWSVKMTYPYGYIRMTEGVDGDHVDCFLGPDEDAEDVYVIHTKEPTNGDYDEDKCMLGFPSASRAKKAFLDNYSDPAFFGSMDVIPFEKFKEKVLSTKDEPAMIEAGGPGSGCNPEVAKCGRPAGEVEESPADQERDKAFNELEAIRDWQQGSHYIRAAATTIVTGVKSPVLYDTDAAKDAAILLDAIRNGTVFTRSLYRGLSVNDPKSPVLALKTGDELQLPMQSFTKELGVAHQFAIGSTPNDTHVVFATEDGTKGLDIAAAVGQGVFNEVEVVTNGKFKVTNVEDVKSFGPDKFHVIHVQQLGTF